MGAVGGKGGSAKAEVNEYYMSVHLGICAGPVDAIVAVIIGDKVAWEGEQTSQGGISIDRKDLFGGEKKEGGVKGTAYYLPGGPTQTLPSFLRGLLPAPVPGFRGFSSLFFCKNENASGGFLWSANSPYFKSPWVRLRRRSNVIPAASGEPSNYAEMPDGQSNPAHMIWDCMTNTDWGMGSPASRLSAPSFQAAAKKLYEEEFGLSMIWTRQSTIETFIQEILDHIQATLYINPRTGLFEIKLIRGGYDVMDMPLLNPDNCTVTRFGRKSWAEVVNEIVVTWTNPENEQEETYTAQDISSVSMQGDVVSSSRNYYGVRKGALAAKLAERDLRAAGSPVASVEIEADRTFWDMNPGDVLRLTYPEHNLYNVAIRVGNVDRGKPGEPKIKITATEDIFGLPGADVFAPPGTDWGSLITYPVPFPYSEIFSLPAYFAAQTISDALTGSEYPEVLVGTLGAKVSDDNSQFDLYAEMANALGTPVYKNLGTKATVDRALLASPVYAEATSTISLASSGLQIAPVVAGFAFIGSPAVGELVCISAVGENSVTVLRGVLDTTPRDWPAGTPIWFFDFSTAYTEETIFAAGAATKFKMLPRMSGGILDIGSAPVKTVTPDDRAYRPSRPANVKVNGTAFGVYIHTGTGDIPVTWSRRNRTTEDNVVLAWGDADTVPETGQTTTITVMKSDRTVLTTHTGLTGTSFSVPFASLGGNASTIFRVTSVRDGFESLQGHEIVVNAAASGGPSGWGNDWGNNWGG